MKEIGGYIEIWQNSGRLFHEGAVALNSARGCLAYLIMYKKIRKILLPYFLCDSVSHLCSQMGIETRFYTINESFLPSCVDLKENEWLYVVNAYGQLTRAEIRALKEQYIHVIVDNVQAYFDIAVEGIDTLYSCRKFFGVTDGAFLYTDVVQSRELERDESYRRMEHLLGRYDKNASLLYDKYISYENSFEALPVKRMSRLTENLLRGVDYTFAKQRRTENYTYLSKRLGKLNKLSLKSIEGAFAYPLLVDNGAMLRKKLIAEKVYVPTLWPNVLKEMGKNTVEYYLAENILPLPCDHRYGEIEMRYVCNLILTRGK